MLLVALLLLLSQEAAKLSLSLSPPTTAVRPGTTVVVGVYLRNTGGKPLDLVPPARMQAKLTSTASTTPVELVRQSPLPAEKTLPPGQSVFAEYELTLPKRLSGRVTLQLERLSAPAVVIDVDPNAPLPAEAPTPPVRSDASTDAGTSDGSGTLQSRERTGTSRSPGDATGTGNPGASGSSNAGVSGTGDPGASGASQPGASAAGHPGTSGTGKPGSSATGSVSTADSTGGRTLPDSPHVSSSQRSAHRFSAHEPNYFLVGDHPSARFQLSFKHQLIDPGSAFGAQQPWWSSIHLGYTQTSVWDVGDSSEPFEDTTHRPEIFVSRSRLDSVRLPFVERFGLDAGFEHASNGRDGDEERGYDAVYVRPIFGFGEHGGFDWCLRPKFRAYLDDDGNSDLSRYRGWIDLELVAAKLDGLEIAAIGRIGSPADRGSLQVDLTYPLHAITQGTLDVFLQAQYFNGYGESLNSYDEHNESLRFGIALSR